MNYSKIIHNYLDGDISPTEEQMLFNALAANSDLREDFNSHLKLQLVAKYDMGRITPPIEATNAIFSGLGFAIPTANSNSGDFKTATNKFKFRNIGFVLLGSIPLILLVVGLTVYGSSLADFLFSNKKQIGSNNSSKFGSNININQIDQNHSSNFELYISSDFQNSFMTKIPFVSSYSNSNSLVAYSGDNVSKFSSRLFNSNSKISTLIKTKSNRTKASNSRNDNYNSLSDISVSIENDNNNNNNNNDNNNSLIRFNSDVPNMPNNSYNSHAFSKSNVLSQIHSDNSLFSLTYVPDAENNISLKFSGFNNSSNVNNGMKNNESGFFNDKSLLIAYHFDKVNALGIEVGKENFPQKYATLGFNNEKIMYSQNPVLNWYGINYQLSMTNLSLNNMAVPYLNSTIAATSIGPLGKIEAGITFNVSNNIEINLGYQYKALFYKVENEIYNTNKYGIIYGISFNY